MRMRIIIAAHSERAVLDKAILETRSGLRYRGNGSVLLVVCAFLWNAFVQPSLFAGDAPLSASVVQTNGSPKDASSPDATDPDSQDRRDLIRKLSILVCNQTGEDPVRDAILLLRKQKTTEAIGLLVDQIGFPEVTPDGARRRMRGGTSRLGPAKDRLPAIPALIEIGPSCVDRVITKMLTTENVMQFEACIAVLQGLDHHASVRERLERAMTDAPRELRARVKRAMETRETTESWMEGLRNAARFWSSIQRESLSDAKAKVSPGLVVKRDPFEDRGPTTDASVPTGSAVKEKAPVSGDPAAKGDNIVLSKDEAITRAAQCIGLREYDRAAVSAVVVTLSGESLPFLGGKLRGRKTWRIEFKNVRLEKAGANSRLANPNITSLIALLAPDTGHVMRVTSVWPRRIPRIASYPCCAEEERQLSKGPSRYTGLPDEAPKVSMLEALANEETMPWGSDVKQIHAYYVLYTKIRYADRPVWVIHLWGFPPLELPVPEGAVIQNATIGERIGHLRNAIDARTGKWLHADNTPRLMPPLENRN